MRLLMQACVEASWRKPWRWPAHGRLGQGRMFQGPHISSRFEHLQRCHAAQIPERLAPPDTATYTTVNAKKKLHASPAKHRVLVYRILSPGKYDMSSYPEVRRSGIAAVLLPNCIHVDIDIMSTSSDEGSCHFHRAPQPLLSTPFLSCSC